MEALPTSEVNPPAEPQTEAPKQAPPPSKPTEQESQPGRPQRESTGKRGPVEKGSFNVFIGILGRPGSGKSQYAVRKALELAKAPGTYVIAHDNNWAIPTALHDGKPTGVLRYETEAEVRDALRAGKTQGLHCVPSGDAGPVVAIAEECAAASLAAHGGEKGYPAVVLIDEVVSAGLCRASYLHPQMERLLTLRRHKNVGCIWTVQSARLVHNQLVSMATRLYVFKLTSGKDLDRLSENGVGDEVLDRVMKLPDYECVEINLQGA